MGFRLEFTAAEWGSEQGMHLSMNPFREWADWPNQASSQAMAKAVDPEEAIGTPA